MMLFNAIIYIYISTYPQKKFSSKCTNLYIRAKDLMLCNFD